MTDNMDFGQALAALKSGRKVAREGWLAGEGHGFVWLKPAAKVRADWCRDAMLKKIAVGNGGEVDASGTLCLYEVDADGAGTVVTGWTPSMRDLLAEDWVFFD